MGYINSSNTVEANAYLTSLGRSYIFDDTGKRFEGGEDRFQIKLFSLSDPDRNYHLNSGTNLDSGKIPDISGENDSCIKGCIKTQELKRVSFDGEVEAPTSGTRPEYVYDVDKKDHTITIDTSNFR